MAVPRAQSWRSDSGRTASASGSIVPLDACCEYARPSRNLLQVAAVPLAVVRSLSVAAETARALPVAVARAAAVLPVPVDEDGDRST
jgi:hypothetical protein